MRWYRYCSWKQIVRYKVYVAAICSLLSLHIYSSIRKYRNIPDKLIIEIIHVGVESSVSNTNVDRIAQKARPKWWINPNLNNVSCCSFGRVPCCFSAILSSLSLAWYTFSITPKRAATKLPMTKRICLRCWKCSASNASSRYKLEIDIYRNLKTLMNPRRKRFFWIL